MMYVRQVSGSWICLVVLLLGYNGVLGHRSSEGSKELDLAPRVTTTGPPVIIDVPDDESRSSEDESDSASDETTTKPSKSTKELPSTHRRRLDTNIPPRESTTYLAPRRTPGLDASTTTRRPPTPSEATTSETTSTITTTATTNTYTPRATQTVPEITKKQTPRETSSTKAHATSPTTPNLSKSDEDGSDESGGETSPERTVATPTAAPMSLPHPPPKPPTDWATAPSTAKTTEEDGDSDWFTVMIISVSTAAVIIVVLALIIGIMCYWQRKRIFSTEKKCGSVRSDRADLFSVGSDTSSVRSRYVDTPTHTPTGSYTDSDGYHHLPDGIPHYSYLSSPYTGLQPQSANEPVYAQIGATRRDSFSATRPDCISNSNQATGPEHPGNQTQPRAHQEHTGHSQTRTTENYSYAYGHLRRPEEVTGVSIEHVGPTGLDDNGYLVVLEDNGQDHVERL